MSAGSSAKQDIPVTPPCRHGLPVCPAVRTGFLCKNHSKLFFFKYANDGLSNGMLWRKIFFLSWSITENFPVLTGTMQRLWAEILPCASRNWRFFFGNIRKKNVARDSSRLPSGKTLTIQEQETNT